MKIQVKFEYPDEMPKIYIDGERLEVSEYSKTYGIPGISFSVEADYPQSHKPVRYTLTGQSFGFAIEAAKAGKKIQREGWNGKNQYVQLASCISYTDPDGNVVNANHQCIGNQALAFVGTSGIQLGWLASQADMLADDWRIVE